MPTDEVPEDLFVLIRKEKCSPNVAKGLVGTYSSYYHQVFHPFHAVDTCYFTLYTIEKYDGGFIAN